MIGAILRCLIPLLAVGLTLLYCQPAKKRLEKINGVFPEPYCSFITFVVIFCIGLAWATGAKPSQSKDCAYAMLLLLLIVCLLYNCRNYAKHRDTQCSWILFTYILMLFAAEDQSNTRVFLAPVLSLLLLDMIHSTRESRYLTTLT